MRHLCRVVGAGVLMVAVALVPPAQAQDSGSITIDDPESGAVLDVTIMGGTITRSERDGWEHHVEGTARPGETISIASSGHGTTWTGRHHVNEDLDATLSVWFDGTDSRENVTLAPGESGSLASSVVVPGDARTVHAVAVLSAAWLNPDGGGSRTLITRIRLDVEEPTTSPPSDTTPPPVATAPPKDCDANPDRTGAYAVSGVRFGDLHGEVNVRPNCADDDAYIFAELATGLMHDDRIRTSPRSGAILSYSDMTTFVMREETVIILDVVSPRESKVGLSVGTVWVNLQSMWKDGSMEVEMAQAVAGIKGTTFVAEQTGTTSTVKVFEGTVAVRPHAGGEILVGPGQMVEVTADGAGPVTGFDSAAELTRWDETVQQMTTEALKSWPSPALFEGGPPPTRSMLLGAIAVVALFAAALIPARRRAVTAGQPGGDITCQHPR